MKVSRAPHGAVVPLFLYPVGYPARITHLIAPDVFVDAAGERWLFLEEGIFPFYEPLPEAYSQEATLAQAEAYELSRSAVS